MKMKNIITKTGISIFVLIFMQSCVSVSMISSMSGVKQKILTDIPKGVRIINVKKHNISADNLYEEVYNILLTRGHRIFKDDQKRHYITTEGRDIGESTLQRMIIVISENGKDSNLKITTEWKAGSDATTTASAMSGINVYSDWAIAKWEISRLGISFAESVAIACEINGEEITYE
jgi:hypothetical protein